LHGRGDIYAVLERFVVLKPTFDPDVYAISLIYFTSEVLAAWMREDSFRSAAFMKPMIFAQNHFRLMSYCSPDVFFAKAKMLPL
jgi:hypothetical protein